MKHIFNFKQFNESKFIIEDILLEATATDIHDKFYKSIDKYVFDEIFKADTVSSNLEKDKIGLYAKWLLSLYKNKKLLTEDLYKATEYITLYDKLKKSNKIEEKDINKIKSLPDLYDVIKEYIGK